MLNTDGLTPGISSDRDSDTDPSSRGQSLFVVVHRSNVVVLTGMLNIPYVIFNSILPLSISSSEKYMH